MNEIFSIEELKSIYGETVVDGKIDFEALSLRLAQEVSDLQDQMNEKDFQILRITERLDKLEASI